MLKGKVGAAEGRLKKEGNHSRRREEPQQQLNSTIPALGWLVETEPRPSRSRANNLSPRGKRREQSAEDLPGRVFRRKFLRLLSTKIGLGPETGCLSLRGHPKPAIREQAIGYDRHAEGAHKGSSALPRPVSYYRFKYRLMIRSTVSWANERPRTWLDVAWH